MPTHGRYHPCIEGKLKEAERRYRAACAALTEALLDEDVVTRLMYTATSIIRTATCPSPR